MSGILEEVPNEKKNTSKDILLIVMYITINSYDIIPPDSFPTPVKRK